MSDDSMLAPPNCLHGSCPRAGREFWTLVSRNILLPVTRAFRSNVDVEFSHIDARFLTLVTLRRTSCAPEFDELRREKQELARTWRAARQAELKANVDSARVSGLVLGEGSNGLFNQTYHAIVCVLRQNSSTPNTPLDVKRTPTNSRGNLTESTLDQM